MDERKSWEKQLKSRKMNDFKDEFQEAARSIMEKARMKMEQDAMEKATKLAEEVVASSMNEAESNIADMLLLVNQRLDKKKRKENVNVSKAAEENVEAGSQEPEVIPAGKEDDDKENEDKENGGESDHAGQTFNLWPWDYPAADIRYKDSKEEGSDWNEEVDAEEIRKMKERQRKEAESRAREENVDDCSWQKLARKLAQKADEEDVSQIRVMEVLMGHWDGNEGRRKLKEALWRYTEKRIMEHVGRMGLAARKRNLENEDLLKLTIWRIEQNTFGAQDIGGEHRAHRLDRIKVALSEHKAVKMTPENRLHIEWGSLLCLIWPGEGRHPKEDNFGDKFSLR